MSGGVLSCHPCGYNVPYSHLNIHFRGDLPRQHVPPKKHLAYKYDGFKISNDTDANFNNHNHMKNVCFLAIIQCQLNNPRQSL